MQSRAFARNVETKIFFHKSLGKKDSLFGYRGERVLNLELILMDLVPYMRGVSIRIKPT